MKLSQIKPKTNVTYAGYPFRVIKVCEWSKTPGSDEAMVEIRGADGQGDACVSSCDLVQMTVEEVYNQYRAKYGVMDAIRFVAQDFSQPAFDVASTLGLSNYFIRHSMGC
jgi:hypothetical protein